MLSIKRAIEKLAKGHRWLSGPQLPTPTLCFCKVLNVLDLLSLRKYLPCSATILSL